MGANVRQTVPSVPYPRGRSLRSRIPLYCAYCWARASSSDGPDMNDSDKDELDMDSRPGYSASVILTLLVGERKLALSHVGPDSVNVREECAPLPPSEAKIVIEVDGETETLEVFLPHGVPHAPQRVEYW